MGSVVTEEKDIIHAQYLDLVYSQSDTLYYLIPHAPLMSNDLARPALEAHVDGMVGSITNAKTTSALVQTSEVNLV
jgi:hypothetical protein